MMLEWDIIQYDPYGETSRLKVYGGWIIRYWEECSGNNCIEFIPDVHHAWKIESNYIKECPVSGVKIDD